MNTIEAIQSRRSIRKYRPEVEIPRDHISRLLEAAMMAPSAGNMRPWEFVVVESKEIKEQIMQAINPYTHMLATASAAIIVCGRPDLQGGLCQGFWPQDCGTAAQNILLAAKDMGYGTCWCGCYPIESRVEAMQKILQVSSIPLAIIALGVPDEAPEAKGFLDKSRIKYM